MALAARASMGPSTSAVSSGHAQSGGRHVASIPYAQVEELSAKMGVQPDANPDFLGFSDWRGKRQPEPEPLHNAGSNFEVTSSAFLAMLGQRQDDSEATTPQSGVKGAFQGLLSRAIRAYEGTAAVIHGDVPPRGTSYSASL